MTQIVSIYSEPGGTGKSNFTANLATTMAMLGKRVGIVMNLSELNPILG